MKTQSAGDDTFPVNRELNPDSGKLFIFSGPSGVGKRTIIKRLMDLPGLQPNYFSVSCTSRSTRGAEVHGKDYYFMSLGEFNETVENESFIEYEEIGDHWYGTLADPVMKALEQGKNVFLSVGVQGALSVLSKMLSLDPRIPIFDVFILPPSLDELERRLRIQGIETDEQIEKSLSRLSKELFDTYSFSYHVVNDDLDDCVKEITKKILKHFML